MAASVLRLRLAEHGASVSYSMPGCIERPPVAMSMGKRAETSEPIKRFGALVRSASLIIDRWRKQWAAPRTPNNLRHVTDLELASFSLLNLKAFCTLNL